MTSVTVLTSRGRIPFQLKSHTYGASSMNNWGTIEPGGPNLAFQLYHHSKQIGLDWEGKPGKNRAPWGMRHLGTRFAHRDELAVGSKIKLAVP